MGRIVRFCQRGRSWWARGLWSKDIAAFLRGIKLLLPYVDTCKLDRDGVMQCCKGEKLLAVSSETGFIWPRDNHSVFGEYCDIATVVSEQQTPI